MVSVDARGFRMWREASYSRGSYDPLRTADNHMDSAAKELIEAGKVTVEATGARQKLVAV